MKSLAIFVHYSRDGKVCPNAMLYAEELTKYFTEVIISSNILIETNNFKIKSLCFKKNAYDFGYFYQALELLDAYEDYNLISFVNDSNYIIGSLDEFLKWGFSNNSNYCGITDSLEKAGEIKIDNQHHVQSHFLIFKNKAVFLLKDFFKKINFENLLKEEDINEIRKKIIIECEIMLSIYMRDNNIKIDSYFKAESFIKNNSSYPDRINMHIYLWRELIENKYPLVKRKIYNLKFSKEDMNFLTSSNLITSISSAKSYIKNLKTPYTETI